MIACFDVYYAANNATAAAIVFSDWRSPVAEFEYTTNLSEVADYEPGKFYLRELAPLLAVIDKIEQSIDTLVIDGYCHLSSDLKPGLGAYLDDALSRHVEIVGVAKNRYRESRHAAEVFRGVSSKALFVTSIGVDSKLAAERVASMDGDFRIPTMLKAVDRLSRTGHQASQSNQ